MPTRDDGFTLVEVLISLVITVIGVVGVISLFIVGTEGQVNARDSSRSVQLAVAELERIRMLPTTHPERADGGSLSANSTDHFVVRGRTTLRWRIQNGPACGPTTWSGPSSPVECTKLIEIVAIPGNSRARPIRIDARLWR